MVVWHGHSLQVGETPHDARAESRAAVGGAAAPRARLPARARLHLTLLPFRMVMGVPYIELWLKS